jgi:hypothetical protein
MGRDLAWAVLRLHGRRLLAAAAFPGRGFVLIDVVRVIPVGIVLLLLEVIVELVVEVVEIRLLIGQRLRDREILLVPEIVIVDWIGGGDEAPGERRTDTGPRGDRVDRA